MKISLSPTRTSPNAPPAATVDLCETLRLALDGVLPPGGGLSHWLDRMEARK